MSLRVRNAATSKEKPDNLLIIRILFLFAEGEGFEPPEPLSSTVFKTAAIDHSAIPPYFLHCETNATAKEQFFFVSTKFLTFFPIQS